MYKALKIFIVISGLFLLIIPFTWATCFVFVDALIIHGDSLFHAMLVGFIFEMLIVFHIQLYDYIKKKQFSK